ncbi:MAG: UPF0280 family protein [Vampirovibrionia bacterium]
MQEGFQKRNYREWVKTSDLITFQATIKETDLQISADKNLKEESLEAIKYYRKQINDHILLVPEFETSFSPIKCYNETFPLITSMYEAGKSANTGPFAAVAGAMAEYVGKELLKYSSQVIVENGGDLFISSKRDRILGIYAGKSILTGKIGLKIPAYLSPVGVCTSSGTVGHSVSFGKADAVIIVSKDTSLADSVATATANMIQTSKDLEKAIDFAKNINNITGIVAIIDKDIAIWGKDIEIVKT